MAGKRLADACIVVMGQSPPGESCNTDGVGVPLLNGPTEYGPDHPAPVQFTTDARKRAKPGDLLFCVRGSTTGRMNWADQEYAIGRGIAAVRHKNDPRLQPFVRAAIEYSLPGLLAQATGSTFPNVSADQLSGLWWPPLNVGEQRAIAHILGTLDDKIELNRRMSETLEAMARALFKSWFVDFDPVRAKAEGRDPGLPQPLADLFPARLVESELGEIPEGWEVKSLDEIARFLNGLALQKYPPVGDRSLPVIKIAQLRAGNTTGSDRASADLDPDYIVKDGEILFSWSGSLESVLWAGGEGALNQHLFKVTSATYPRWLCYLGVHAHLDDFRHIAAGKATTMGHIQRHHLSDAKLAVPPAQLLGAMSEHLAPMIESLWRRKVDSRTLAALRDTLLPKLISGELRVNNPERVAGIGAE
ncbi:MAG: restriction endonuclease subunit S [Deltaproteobacteria bacterium]|nr:restriction endonuclease subunit S [Deltaproteobacteria bacterium]